MYYKRNIPLSKHGMVPNCSFSQAMSSCIVAMLPENFYERVEKGSIVIKRSNNFAFCKDSLVLDGGGDCVKADVVILATGFKGDQKLRDVFASPWFKQIVAGSPSTKVPLYRLSHFF
jgi:dimethylaniline monooxygenase (N-oxide forming)